MKNLFNEIEAGLLKALSLFQRPRFNRVLFAITAVYLIGTALVALRKKGRI